MPKTETARGETYPKRDPLGVLGLTIVTLGIYGSLESLPLGATRAMT